MIDLFNLSEENICLFDGTISGRINFNLKHGYQILNYNGEQMSYICIIFVTY